MATKSIGSGKDYANLNDWEAADCGGSGAAIGEVYGTITESTSVTIDTTVPDSITLRPATGEGHTGAAGTGAKITWSASGNVMFLASTAKAFTLQQMEVNAAGLAKTTIVSLDAPATHTVERCIIHNINRTTTTTVYGILANNASLNANLNNNLIYNIRGDGNVYGIYAAAVGTENIYNNTIDLISTDDTGSTYTVYGLRVEDNANCIAKNNLISRTTGGGTGTYANYYDSSITSGTSATNGGDDSSSPDGASYRSLTITRTSSTDYTPTSGSSANVLSGGTDLGSTAAVDLKGRNRDTSGDTWSLGCIQYVSAVADLSINVADCHGFVESLQ